MACMSVTLSLLSIFHFYINKGFIFKVDGFMHEFQLFVFMDSNAYIIGSHHIGLVCSVQVECRVPVT